MEGCGYNLSSYILQNMAAMAAMGSKEEWEEKEEVAEKRTGSVWEVHF